MITARLQPDDSDADDTARCSDGQGTLSHLFFSEDDTEIAAAQRICRSCPRQRVCLATALLRREQIGVWGGKVFQNGEPLDQRRRRGRPPKRLVS